MSADSTDASEKTEDKSSDETLIKMAIYGNLGLIIGAYSYHLTSSDSSLRPIAGPNSVWETLMDHPLILTYFILSLILPIIYYVSGYLIIEIEDPIPGKIFIDLDDTINSSVNRKALNYASGFSSPMYGVFINDICMYSFTDSNLLGTNKLLFILSLSVLSTVILFGIFSIYFDFKSDKSG